LINDLTTREKTLREKLACIEGERDNLLGTIKNMKKESLKLEESNYLLESKILKYKDDLKDWSSFDS